MRLKIRSLRKTKSLKRRSSEKEAIYNAAISSGQSQAPLWLLV